MSRTLARVACSKCQRRNDPWRKFCSACGGALVGACQACGAVNEPSDKFCGGCARSLAKTAAPIAGKAKPPPPIPKAAPQTIQIAVLDDAVLAEHEHKP
jgi:predicted amidophosphoribosyltransferase